MNNKIAADRWRNTVYMQKSKGHSGNWRVAGSQQVWSCNRQAGWGVEERQCRDDTRPPAVLYTAQSAVSNDAPRHHRSQHQHPAANNQQEAKLSLG